MLEVKEVGKKFKDVVALANVSFSLRENEVLALIGESGSGKSTLAEIIVGLNMPTTGKVLWYGKESYPHERRQEIQFIFQNPDRSLNPYWTVEELLLEPLLLKKWKRADALRKIKEMLTMVELPQNMLEKFPRECSGGQKQRVAIARALSLQPKLLIADEITASLDPETEQAIIALLRQLKKQSPMSIVYITHRLQTIQDWVDTMIVLKDGEMVETGCPNELLCFPKHDYTKCLLDACHLKEGIA